MTASLLHIPQLLTAQELATVQALLDQAEWQADSLHGQTLPEDIAAARQCGAIVGTALGRNARFMSAALPAHIAMPQFIRHGTGQTPAAWIDGALRHSAGQRVRNDLSATLFLTPPEAYDGGELTFAQGSINHRIRLAAGDLLLYPAHAIHAVAPVTRGGCLASALWVQSIIRDAQQRQMLYDLDQTIQGLGQGLGQGSGGAPEGLVALTGHYHNLVRMWAEG